MKVEYKIGEIFKYQNHYLRVEESEDCERCFFFTEEALKSGCTKKLNGKLICNLLNREDKTNIIYKKLSEIEELILKGDESDTK